MKAIRETRLVGAFLLMIVLGVLLKSHFFNANTSNTKCTFLYPLVF